MHTCPVCAAVVGQAIWLAQHHVQALSEALLKQWAEQGPGGPIMFTWVDWLRSSALERLGLQRQLVITEELVSGPGPTAATATGAGPSTSSGTSQLLQRMPSLLVRMQRYGSGALAQGAAGAGADAGGPPPICTLEGLAVMLLRYAARRDHERFCEMPVRCASALRAGAARRGPTTRHILPKPPTCLCNTLNTQRAGRGRAAAFASCPWCP